MLCALIMAGGIGSRFWPQSTEKKPKQFLKLLGEKTMIQMTYERINKLVPKERIFIVTNSRYVNLVKEQINGINDINIILEPCSKNTAPCILLSSFYLKKLYQDANVVCISSDSYIKDEDEFIKKIEIANNFINNNHDAIVTIGIKPNRPETGYGYIKYEKNDNDVLKVDRFVEKPNLEKALEYVKSDEYLWNAGMFIFNTETMLSEIEKNDNINYSLLKDLPNISSSNYYSFLNDNYSKCEKISIDYAVMEKSKNVYTIPSDIGWDDIGTWSSLERYIDKDMDNNIKKGDIDSINSHNNIIYGNGKKIIIMNIDNIFCIDSDETIIIGPKDDINKINDILKQS